VVKHLSCAVDNCGLAAVSITGIESENNAVFERRLKKKLEKSRTKDFWDRARESVEWDERTPERKASIVFRTGMILLLVIWGYLLVNTDLASKGYGSLARFLLDNGFNVTKVYLDAVPAADREDFEYLRDNDPDLMLHPTVHSSMRFASGENSACASDADSCRVLAIGQKAAYFENTDHFVNVVEGGGMTGYKAITETLRLMRDAYENRKPMRDLVQIKGLGCEVCVR
jgi:hypothetical protein